MANIRELIRHSSHHLGGRAVLMVLGFVSFPIFTRIFSVADYGTINLVLQTALIFTVLSKAGLQNSVQRFELKFAQQGAAQKKGFFFTVFFGNAAVTAACAAVFVIGVMAVPAGWLPPSAKKMLLLGCVLFVVRAVRAMYANMLQVEGKTLAYNVLEVAIKIATVAAICALALRWQRTALAFLLGLVIAEAGALLVLFPEIVRRTGTDVSGFDAKLLRNLIQFGLPLMWAELAWVVLDSGDRFLLQFFRGTEAVGYYAAAYNISLCAQDVILTPLNMAFFPVCVEIWTKHGEEETKEFLGRTFAYFVLAAAWVVAMSTGLSDNVIVLLASRKYLQAQSLLPWLVAGLTICASQVFFRASLMLRRQPMKVAYATALAAIFNVGLNIVLIPWIGILGAAIATFLSYAFWIILMARAAFKAFRFPISYSAIGRYLLAGATVACALRLIHIENTIASLLVRLLVGSIGYPLILMVFDRDVRELVQRYILPAGLVQKRYGRAPDSLSLSGRAQGETAAVFTTSIVQDSVARYGKKSLADGTAGSREGINEP
ncbi:MAG: flippase [Acidobacteriia bacterium]|nr:flippase [Terriglobia bacterium]